MGAHDLMLKGLDALRVFLLLLLGVGLALIALVILQLRPDVSLMIHRLVNQVEDFRRCQQGCGLGEGGMISFREGGVPEAGGWAFIIMNTEPEADAFAVDDPGAGSA